MSPTFAKDDEIYTKTINYFSCNPHIASNTDFMCSIL